MVDVRAKANRNGGLAKAFGWNSENIELNSIELDRRLRTGFAQKLSAKRVRAILRESEG
jgi:hypothetical protein